MRKVHLITSLILIIGSTVNGQTIITGKIVDDINEIIIGAAIIQTNTNNATYSDFDGSFSLRLKMKKELSIEVKFVGYETKIISISDSIKLPLEIQLEPALTGFGNPNSKFYRSIYLTDVIARFRFDIYASDFTEFEPLLATYNTELMDIPGDYSFEFGLQLNPLYTGISMGALNFEGSYPDTNDSIAIHYNITHWGIHSGYYIIHRRRVEIGPTLSFKWYRYRLINSNIDRKIPIETYLEQRDLDIRFNQFLMIAGLHTEFKIYNARPFNKISFGLHCGYCMKLNNTPLVYSTGSRLKTSNTIRISKLRAGLTISIYL